MKKKTLYLLGSVFILISIIAMTFFANLNNDAIQSESLNLKGSWRVVAYTANNSTQLIDDEFMVFGDDTASDYRYGEMFVNSIYSISEGNILNLPDISKKYTVDMKSEYNIRLYENASTYMELIRYPEDTITNTEVDNSILIGSWNVIYRNIEESIDEQLIFTNDELQDYRNGSETPTLSSKYIWKTPSSIFVESISTEMQFHVYSNDIVYFIESGTGYVWVLQRIA